MPRNSHAYRISALTALLALSFALVTVYFREGDNGGLHGTQRWLGDVFAPASGVRRMAGYFSSRYSQITLESMMMFPSSMSDGTTPFGLILRYSGLR